MTGKHPHGTFGLHGTLTLANETNPGGEQASGGKCLSPCTCELACPPPQDRLSPPSSTRLYPGLRPFRGSGHGIAALRGLPCNFLGEKADFHSKARLTVQWCFCLTGPNFAFGLGSAPCCVVAAPQARGSHPALCRRGGSLLQSWGLFWQHNPKASGSGDFPL